MPAQPAQLLPALDPTRCSPVLGWHSDELQKTRHRSWAAGRLRRRNPRAPTGQLPHRAWALTQPEEGQAESTSVSIETIAAQGRALGCTGTWGLNTFLLPDPGPGMVVKAYAQTCAPRKSWKDLGHRANSGAQLQVGWAVCCQKWEQGQVSPPVALPGHSSSCLPKAPTPILGVPANLCIWVLSGWWAEKVAAQERWHL